MEKNIRTGKASHLVIADWRVNFRQRSAGVMGGEAVVSAASTINIRLEGAAI